VSRDSTKITSGADAKTAAEAVVSLCTSAWFAAPEDTAAHLRYVNRVCAELDKIVIALKLRSGE
jgi:hypothetical protein